MSQYCTAPISDASIRDVSIMIIDDNQFNLSLISEILHNAGFTNLQCYDRASDALETLSDYQPQMIILDLVMPDMDGFTFCEQARKSLSFYRTPILIQTSMNNVQQRLEAFDKGANDMILKPINPREFVLRVEKLLEYNSLINDLQNYRSRTQHEMEQARAMQLALMPNKDKWSRLEEANKITISGYFSPSDEIGGDIWGTYSLSDTELFVYNCDFSGHGILAAIYTFRLHAMMREHLDYAGEPGTFMSKVNTMIYPIVERGKFATFFAGVIDSETNELRYATAGCPNPILFRHKQETPEIISGAGLPLAAIESTTYETQSVPFNPHDTLMLYSDALIETRVTQSGAFLNEEKLAHELNEEFIHCNDHAKAQQNALKILLRKLKIIEGNTPNDDLTLAWFTRN